MTQKKDKTIDEDTARARHITWVGFWVNAALGVAKIAGGVFGRSAALIADGVHSFSDFLSDIIVLVMVGVARKEPDNGHPFGHGRFETLATILLSVILFAVAGGIFYDGLERVISVVHGHTIPRPGGIALVILVASIIAKEWLFYATRRVGREIRSEAVIANAWHHRSDSLSSIATLIGVSGAMFLGESWRILDPIAAMVVSIFIIIVGIQMARPAISELLGASLPQADQDKIESTLKGIDGVLAWHHLRTFKSGKDAVIEVHLKMNPELNVRDAHAIATKAEKEIRAALPHVDAHVTTHIEPIEDD